MASPLGTMRHRFAVYSVSDANDANGVTTQTETLATTLWGRCRPLNGRERFVAAQSTEIYDFIVELRYYSPLTARHILVHADGRRFQIISVSNELERDRFTICQCREVPQQ